MMQGRSRFAAFYTFLVLTFTCCTALAQSALQPGAAVQINLPAQNYVANYYIDTDASAKQLTISVNGTGGADVDLFVRFGTPFPTSPVLVGEETLIRYSQYHSFSNGSSESVSILPSSRVPLGSGRWYIAVINSEPSLATTATLTATSYTSPQVATIGIDFSSPQTNASDPTEACDTAPWTDSTAVAAVGGNPGTTLGQQRQNALKYAVQQIQQQLQPPVPITIHACWAHLGGNGQRAIIAHATPVTFLVDEPKYGGYVLPLRYTWYAITEAVRAGGASQCGLTGGPCGGVDNEEIEATFNEDIGLSTVIGGEAFYYGYSASANQNTIDFVSVAMHELTHGLGFIGLANTDSTLGPVGAKAGITNDSSGASIAYDNLTEGPYDDVYDVNAAIVNSANNAYVPFMGYEVTGSGDAARASALVSNNGLRWSDATAVNSSVNANRNLPAPQNFPLLFAPFPISNGSTLSHTTQDGDLMNAVYPRPAPRTMGLALPMLGPLGWSSSAAPAPVFTQPIPSNWFDRSHGGHGIDLQLARHDAQLGDVYILVFYTYSASGAPEWYLATGNIVDGVFVGNIDSNGNTLLYSTYGSSLGFGQLHPTPQANVTGTVTVDFNQAAKAPACRNVDRSNASQLAVMNWNIGNDSGDWCMEPLITQARHATPDYNGHWYAPTDSGWGMELLNFDGNASSSTVFLVIYYPDAAGLPAWALASGTLSNGSANLQVLKRSNGYCRTCTPPASSDTSVIGSMSLQLHAGVGTAAPTGKATFTINYPGGGSFSRAGDDITLISLPTGQ